MKKLLASMLLILPISAMTVLADEDFGITVPEWKDFAPTAFVNVKEPKGLGKLNVTARYWYDRKVNFDNEISACKELESNDDRFNCYEAVKVEQYKENSNYNARLEAKYSPTVPGMGNPTDTMIPINGYLNNAARYMPNEFR